MTLSLILRFNLRLGNYSIWSVSTLRTIYDQDFGTWAPHSLEAKGSTWRTTRRIWNKNQNQPKRYSDYLKHSIKGSEALEGMFRALEALLVVLKPNSTIRKCTDTDVAFTLEYSRVSNPRGMRSVLSSESCLSRGYDWSEEVQVR